LRAAIIRSGSMIVAEIQACRSGLRDARDTRLVVGEMKA
jgi:hypothetical protein